MKESNFKQNKCWGGKRECAGRKKTCRKKVPFNRRINEDVLNILREYAQSHNMTETEALESAIILQSNVEKLKGDKMMKIVIHQKKKNYADISDIVSTLRLQKLIQKLKKL